MADEERQVSKRLRRMETAATTLKEELKRVYGGLPSNFLWDTTKVWELIHPTYAFSHASINKDKGSGVQHSEYLGRVQHFEYLGRRNAKKLWEDMASMTPGEALTILGAKGSGKSTVVAAIAGNMIAADMPVVYICGSRFVQAPAQVLCHSLMVACGSLSDLHGDQLGIDGLILWCMTEPQDSLLFVVDEWEEVVKAGKELTDYLTQAVSIYHKLVKVVSGNSRDRHLLSTNDQPPPVYQFDGPYTSDELATWIAHCQLPESKLQIVDTMTGGMPRLLKFFREAAGNVRKYLGMIDPLFTNKLQVLVKKQETQSQVLGFLDLLLTGKRDGRVNSDFDFTCFFRTSEGRIRPLCPYLRARAEAFIMDQQTDISRKLELGDIEAWANAVLMDGTARKKNPARAGWIVESLVLSVMRYQGCVWPGADFESYRTYERGRETMVLRSLNEQQLARGVFVAPVEFNEAYVDAMYVLLEGTTLYVKAVQISVSTWERKKRKKSHVLWQERMLPLWLAEGWHVTHQFVYVLPTKVKGKVVESTAIDSKVVEYLASDAAAEDDDASGGEEEDYGLYGDAEYDDDIELDKVVDVPLEFKTFGDIHHCLSKFDRMLRPLTQVKVEKPKMMSCSGCVLEKDGTRRPCKNKCRTDNQAYTCRVHSLDRQPEL